MFENFGIGVDIETVNRFRKLNRVKDVIFLEKIFTKNELDYCFSKKDNAGQHLTARFAGKEAIIKALSSINEIIVHQKIEIINNKIGVPIVKLKSSRINFKIKLSLSHCEDKAIAFAIAIKA